MECKRFTRLTLVFSRKAGESKANAWADRNRGSNDRKRGREAGALRAVLGHGLPAKGLSGI